MFRVLSSNSCRRSFAQSRALLANSRRSQASLLNFALPAMRGSAAGHLGRLSSSPERRISGESTAFMEEMHRQWSRDPSSVHPSWRVYFEGGQQQLPQAQVSSTTGFPGASPGAPASTGTSLSRILHLVQAYQQNGHLQAQLDPLGLQPIPHVPELDITHYGWTEADLDLPIDRTGFGKDVLASVLGHADAGGDKDGATTLRELVELLRHSYCGKVGIEFKHISSLEKRQWLQEKVEIFRTPLEKEARMKILDRLTWSDHFEKFLATKFNTAKRFGLEGLDTVIPGLKALIDQAVDDGVIDVVCGMPHRGRLNVLANVIRKPMEMIFREFRGIDPPQEDDYSGSGDVKYHMGMYHDKTGKDGRRVRVSLLPNPSHLEAVNPLVCGKARAKMIERGDMEGHEVMPLILHGDAAFAGQGIVYETMQMAGLEAFQTGGTIHVICNNNIGFTADPAQSRSTVYASDIGKGFDIPIFHVNADSPEDVCRVFQLAAQYRGRFHTDVIIDVIGYRRYGHNEIDEPKFTQPLQYGKIANQPTALKQYQEYLLAEGIVTPQEIEAIEMKVENILKKAYDDSDTYEVPEDFWTASPWTEGAGEQQLIGADVLEKPLLGSGHPDTGIQAEDYDAVSKALTTTVESFQMHRTLRRIIDRRKVNLEEGENIDWATAEALAFGALLREGVHVRLTGEDVERGTFSQRHAVLHNQSTGERYIPLDHVEGAKAPFACHNSLLSEYAVLGYELGYSMESPNNLVLWEAQFGDFANAAQVTIDNFIVAMEAKWRKQTGLVLLLPHGYDGQGPEHSSCRIERFLQSSDEDPDFIDPSLNPREALRRTNWRLVNVTTPAQYFHVLRSQIFQPFRKPLIVASPKALLRHRLCVSQREDFMSGNTFHRLLPELEPEALLEPEKIRRVVMCSGKIYYELLAARREQKVKDVALIRIEQLTPFPFDQVAAQMRLYSNAELVWTQEEPKNMGAWTFVRDTLMTATRFYNKKEIRPGYVGRGTMASPAEGYGEVHDREQAEIIETALSDQVDSWCHGRVGFHEE